MRRTDRIACGLVSAFVLVLAGDGLGAVRTWDGGDADFSVWSAVTNWDGDVSAPVDGDSLVFGGAVRPASVNDLVDLSVAGVTFGEAGFSLSGNVLSNTAGFAATGDSGWSIPTVLPAGAHTFTVNSGTLTMSGLLSGAGSVTKAAANGTLLLSASNSYAGGTTIAQRQGAVNALRISDSKALGTGTLTIGGGGNNDMARLELAGGITVSNAVASLTSRNNTVPNILNVSGDNTMTANIAGGSGGTRSAFQSDAGLLTLSGLITTRELRLRGSGGGRLTGEVRLQGTYGVVKEDAGDWTIDGVGTYAGATVVAGGRLIVNGALRSTPSVTVSNGATLTGSGSIAGLITVADGGVLAPGNSPGILSVSNSVTLGSGAFFQADIWGYGPGTEFDRLRLDGASDALQLGGSMLVVDLNGFNPTNGAAFAIVSGFTGDPGSFGSVSLLNADDFNAAGKSFGISYNADDITLAVIPEPGAMGLFGMALVMAGWMRRRQSGAR